MRYSRQREAIIKLLSSTTSHPDAEWLYLKLREEYPNISLGTVYRNLRQLSEGGEILEIHSKGISHFDATTDEHYHMYCNKCGGIFDIDKEQVKLIVKESDEYTIEDFSLLLKGICGKCRNCAEQNPA